MRWKKQKRFEILIWFRWSLKDEKNENEVKKKKGKKTSKVHLIWLLFDLIEVLWRNIRGTCRWNVEKAFEEKSDWRWLGENDREKAKHGRGHGLC